MLWIAALTLNRRLTEAYPAWNLVNDTRQLSDDPRANPTLYNWNVVWVKTCDGGSWTGNREQPEMVDGTPLYYRGRRILDAMIDDLIPRGILNATVSRQGQAEFEPDMISRRNRSFLC